VSGEHHATFRDPYAKMTDAQRDRYFADLIAARREAEPLPATLPTETSDPMTLLRPFPSRKPNKSP
jgi:hypothetical protein